MQRIIVIIIAAATNYCDHNRIQLHEAVIDLLHIIVAGFALLLPSSDAKRQSVLVDIGIMHSLQIVKMPLAVESGGEVDHKL